MSAFDESNRPLPTVPGSDPSPQSIVDPMAPDPNDEPKAAWGKLLLGLALIIALGITAMALQARGLSAIQGYSEVKGRIDSLRAEAADLETARDRLTQEVAQKRANAAHASDELQSVESTLAQAKELERRAVVTTRQAVGQLARAREEQAGAEERAEAARQRYDEAIRERTAMQTSITTLEITKSNLELSVAALSASRNSLAQVLKDLEMETETLDALTEQVSDRRNALRTEEKRMATLRAEFEAITAQLAQAASIETDIVSLAVQKQSLETDLPDLRGRRTAITNEITDLERLHLEVIGKLGTLRAELAADESKTRRLAQDAMVIQAQIAEFEAKARAASDTAAEEAANMTVAKARLSTVERDLAERTAEAQAAVTRVSELDTQIAESEAKARAASDTTAEEAANMTVALASLSTVERDLAERTAEAQAAVTRVGELDTQIASLRAQKSTLDQALAQKKEVEDGLADLRTTEASLTERIANRTRGLIQLGEQIRDLRSQEQEQLQRLTNLLIAITAAKDAAGGDDNG